MPRAAWLSAFALLAVAAAPATVPSADEINALVTRLGDVDPAARAQANDRLAALGQVAVPALRTAARGQRPAIADAAAELLLHGDWTIRSDPQSVKLMMTGYGASNPVDRAEAVRGIIRMTNLSPAVESGTDYRAIAVRILTRDPSDEVGSRRLDSNAPDAPTPDAAWQTALTTAGVDNLTPPLRMFLARAKDHAGDQAGALALVQSVLDSEQAHPGASGQWLSWGVKYVVESETRRDNYGEAAARLRDLIGKSGDDPASLSSLTDQLLDLHARHGPLAGFADDVKQADADPESRSTYAIAMTAERIGLPLVGGTLLQAALRPHLDEADADHAARLTDAADALTSAGQIDAACRVWDEVAKSESPQARSRVTLAYLRLSRLHDLASRPALAGDALQRAIDRQDSPFFWTRAGRDVVWPIEDMQARVYWFYLLDAKWHGDAAAVTKQARLILASGSTDGGQFLDVLPFLEPVASRDEMDAYFLRVFDHARQDMDANPNEPMYVNDLAWLCARSNRKLPEAVTWARRAVAISPNEPMYLDTLAEALCRTGKAKESVELEKKALLTPSDDEDFMRRQLKRFETAATTQPG